MGTFYVSVSSYYLFCRPQEFPESAIRYGSMSLGVGRTDKQ